MFACSHAFQPTSRGFLVQRRRRESPRLRCSRRWPLARRRRAMQCCRRARRFLRWATVSHSARAHAANQLPFGPRARDRVGRRQCRRSRRNGRAGLRAAAGTARGTPATTRARPAGRQRLPAQRARAGRRDRTRALRRQRSSSEHRPSVDPVPRFAVAALPTRPCTPNRVARGRSRYSTRASRISSPSEPCAPTPCI